MNAERLRSIASHAALPLAALLIVVVGVLAGLRLAGPVTENTALGRVSYELAVATNGGVEAYVPLADWGLRSEAFSGPFELRLELRTVEREALIDAAADDPSVLDQVRSDLEDGALGAILRALAWSLGVVLALAALAVIAWPRARRSVLAFAAMVAGFFVLVVGGGIAIAWTSFDEAALESPTYYARGAELERLLAAAESETVESAYGSELESILRSVSAVLTNEPIRSTDGRELFLASDLHANALVIDPVADFVGEAPVIFAGDFGQRGTAAEASLLAERVAALGDPVLAVSGNHDSDLLMDELADAGVDVIDRPPGSPPVDVDGLTIAGYPDPLEGSGPDLADPDREITFEALPDGEERFERAAEELRAWFDTLEPAPDVVVVHQVGLARALAGSLWVDDYDRPLTIATGHDHLQHIDRYGPITVVDGGSVGAGGVFEAGTAYAGFAKLHFETSSSVLRAVDLIEIEPFSGRGRGSRVVIDTICPDEERCTYTPSEPQVDVPDAMVGTALP